MSWGSQGTCSFPTPKALPSPAHKLATTMALWKATGEAGAPRALQAATAGRRIPEQMPSRGATPGSPFGGGTYLGSPAADSSWQPDTET